MIEKISSLTPAKRVGSVKNVQKQNDSKNSVNRPSQNKYHATKQVMTMPLGRKFSEHNSWGASVDKRGNINFKIATFPDAQKVSVEVLKSDGKVKILPLKNKNGKKDGVFEEKSPKGFAEVGDKYKFIIEKADGTINKVKDPYAMKQPSGKDLREHSIIYNHHSYNWQDKDWMSHKVPERVSRIPNKNLTPVGGLRIYEINIATLTKEGNIESAKKELEKISQNKKFNAIHIMPLENTYDYNWGYDGVDKFAPAEHLGGPDKTKELIDYAHKLKLNVIMDMVPNHLGPDGANLKEAGPYVGNGTPWGDGFNYEGKNNKPAREYIVNAALNWANNYHCDGIRFDMTKFMYSDYTMKQIAAEVHYHNPDVVLIAEDGRENDWRVTKPLYKHEECRGKSEAVHSNVIEKIENNDISIDNIGFDSEWDFKFHKQLAAAILGEWEMGQYKLHMENQDRAIRNSGNRIKYPMSHDEIGNWDGTRLMVKYVANNLGLNNCVQGSNPAEYGQRIQHAAAGILKSYATGELKNMNHAQRNDFYKKLHVTRDISVDEVEKAYNRGVQKQKLALGKVFSCPGPKMVFQGDDNANLSYFKFFRKFSSGDEPYLRDKGYEPGEPALKDSKLNSINYTPEIRTLMGKVEKFTADLNKFNAENTSLQDGSNFVGSIVHHGDSNLHLVYCADKKNHTVSVASFNDKAFSKYNIHFPPGIWMEEINSNDKKYGGTGAYLNSKPIISNGLNKVTISVPENGIMLYKKID